VLPQRLEACTPGRAGKHVAPNESWDPPAQEKPKLISEHRDRMAGVLVVPCLSLMFAVMGVRH
jgi:hypothetical protein